MQKYVRYSEASVHIASAITAYARINLNKYKEHIFKMGGKVYYCDTDSLVTDLKLLTSMRLGKLKLEYRICEGFFIAPKSYLLILKNFEGEVIKFKGPNSDFFKNFRNNRKVRDIFIEALAVNGDNTLPPYYYYLSSLNKEFKNLTLTAKIRSVKTEINFTKSKTSENIPILCS